MNSLLAVNLGEDLDVFTVLTELFPDLAYVSTFSDRGCDIVNFGLESELRNVTLIFIGKRRLVDNGAGKMDQLFLTEDKVIVALTNEA